MALTVGSYEESLELPVQMPRLMANGLGHETQLLVELDGAPDRARKTLCILT